MFNSQTVDRLMLGIESIISENRSSLSEEEITLLKECITLLETLKIANGLKRPESINIVSSVINILLRVLLSEDIHKVKDLFF